MATRKAVKACLDATAVGDPRADPRQRRPHRQHRDGPGRRRSPSRSSTPAADLIHYGIREHGMGGVMTGMAAHGGILPVGGTFFVFSDYMRGAVRLAALSDVHVIYSWTHDSIGLGQDGPTHQPIEQLAAVRAMPGLRVIRPADANETAQAWRIAVDSDGPTALILSRQAVPVLAGTADRSEAGVARGAYVLSDPEAGPPRLSCRHRQRGPRLPGRRRPAGRVRGRRPGWCRSRRGSCSPSRTTTTDARSFPPGVPRLAVEAASSFGWERYAERPCPSTTSGRRPRAR